MFQAGANTATTQNLASETTSNGGLTYHHQSVNPPTITKQSSERQPLISPRISTTLFVSTEPPYPVPHTNNIPATFDLPTTLKGWKPVRSPVQTLQKTPSGTYTTAVEHVFVPPPFQSSGLTSGEARYQSQVLLF